MRKHTILALAVCLYIVALGFIAVAQSSITFGYIYTCDADSAPKDVFWVSPDGSVRQTVYAKVIGTGSKSLYRIYVVQNRPVDGENLTDFSGNYELENKIGTFQVWENPELGEYFVVLNPYDDEAYTSDSLLNNFTVSTDDFAPSIEITAPVNGTWLKDATVTVSGNTSDSESGLQRIQVQVDEGVPFDASSTDTWSAITQPLIDGSHSITAKAFDNVGNTKTTTVTFNVDTEGPQVTIINLVDGDVYNSSTLPADVLYTATDNLDSSPTVEVVGWSTDEGVHTVTVTATDLAGNLGSDSVQYTVDYTPPEGTILINDGAQYTTSTSVTLDLSATDNGSGVSQMRFSNDEIIYSDWEPYTTPKSWNLSDGDGQKTVYYQIKDKAGLISETYSDTIILTTVGPTGSLLINEDAQYTNSTSVNLTLKYNDLLDLSSVRFSNDNKWAGVSWGDPSFPKPWSLATGDGEQTVYCQTNNTAGVVSTFSDIIILDTTPPTGSVTISEGAATNQLVVSLTLTASDATSGVSQMRFSTDGIFDTESWETFSATTAWNLLGGDGDKTIYVQFRDNAGCVSETYTASILLDTSPPSTPIPDGPTDWISYNTPTLTWLVSDDEGSGVEGYYYHFDGGSETWTVFTSVASQPQPDGKHVFYVKAQDNVGNIGDESSFQFHIDTTPPAVAVASPAEGETIQSSNVTVVWSGLDAGSGLEGYEVRIDTEAWVYKATSTSHTFTGLSEGSHIVYISAVDNIGNSQEYSRGFSVGAAPQYTLTVTSAYGSSNPAVGAHVYNFGVSVTCSVVSPVSVYETVWTCVGWTGTGSVPSSGYGTSVTFAITQDSTIKWVWQEKRTPETPATPSTGRLIVIVKGTNNNAVEGATVTSTSQPAGQNALQGKTDSTGTVTFDNIKAGSYTIQVSKGEAEATPQTTVIKSRETTTITLTLQSETQPPSVSVNLNVASSVTNHPWFFTIIAGNGVANVTLCIDGNPVETWTMAGTHIYTGDAYSIGTHTYFVEAYDNNGNRIRETSAVNLQFTVEASKEPVAIEFWKILSVIAVLACGTGLLIVVLKPKKTYS